MQFVPSGNGESNDRMAAGLRYFGFESLRPIETNDGSLSYLTIGSNVAEDSTPPAEVVAPAISCPTTYNTLQ